MIEACVKHYHEGGTE